MSFRDGILASGVGGTFAIGADLIINGGEVLALLATILLENGGLVYIILSRLLSAAPEVAWLPAAKLQTAFTVVSLLLAAFALYRLARRAGRSISERV